MKAELNRVAVIVKDVDKACKDFEEIFGITFYGPYDDEYMGLRVALPRHGGFELIAPTRDDDKIHATQKLAEHGEGITGIALRVDSMEEAKKELTARGWKPDTDFAHGEFKEIMFFASDKTHGVEIAINEFPDANGGAIEVAKDMGYDPLA